MGARNADRHARRALDLAVLAVVALPATLLMALIAIAVRVDSPGPIFYRARRVGRDGVPFTMWKFRTMRHGVAGPPLSAPDDPRFTRVGRLLSRSKLDELPQLLNVLRGEMALVGPRPEDEAFVALYPEEFDAILTVAPGITGPAQLAHVREHRMLAAGGRSHYVDTILPAKLALDRAYVEHRSALGDLKLIAKTVALVASLPLAALAARRGRWLAIGALGALALVAIALAGASAHAATPRQAAAGDALRPVAKGIWGPVRLPDGRSAFELYEELGVDVYSTTLSWAATARTDPRETGDPADPANPAYRWPEDLDVAVREARRRGIRVALTVQYAPPWANGGREREHAPEDPQDYATFLRAVARRYPSIRFWLIWGEPTRNMLPMPATGCDGARRYARLVDAAYRELKAIRRANQVIAGNTYTSSTPRPFAWLRCLRLDSGQPPPLDYYGHNPYSYRYPDLADAEAHPELVGLNDVERLERRVRRTYGRRVRLWLSEYSIQSDHDSWAFGFHVSREEQAEWLTAAYGLVNDFVRGRGRRSYRPVALLGWYRLADEDSDDPNGLTVGLVDRSFKPKPAFTAYKRVPSYARVP